ncbi:MAG: acyl-CoA dehydrogenase [Peptococcaceae bacterium]|jgi:alkylation response protein AidB-like acyl-CoA dehydrogenase|nr:acyl-CoA dehydrogenase [Peptococcaceae bacterium]
MSYTLTEEQQLIQQNVREFAEEYVQEHTTEIDSSGEFPTEIVGQAAEQGLFALLFPEEFGGVEAGFLSYILTVEEVSRTCAALGSIIVNHCSLAAEAINRFGSKEQKEQYLPAMCAGETIGAFALNEFCADPGYGESKVVAVREGQDYVLNGKKYFVMNSGAAGVYVVFALTNPENIENGMSAFLVEAETPGFSVGRTIDKMGLNGCPTAEIVLENVRVPATNLLGKENEGMKIVQKLQPMFKLALAAQTLGIAQSALENSIEYAKQRVQFGRPIGKFPAIQTMIAEMAANIHIGRLALYDAAEMVEKGDEEEYETKASMVQLFVNKIGQKTCLDAIQVHGGYGYSQEMLVSRLLRDVKGTIAIDSASEFPEKIIAQNIMGL